MNVQLNIPSFKGKYLVKGTKSDISELEKKIQDRRHKVYQFSKFQINLNSDNAISLFTTNEDAIALSSAKENPQLPLKPNRSITLKENIFNVLVSVFGRKKEIKEIPIYNANEILSKENLINFNYEKGFLKNSFPVTCLDGNKRTYYSTGAVKSISYKDGSFKSFFQSGNIKTTSDVDGSKKSYYETGQIKSEEYPDGSIVTYYSDGQMSSKKDSNGYEETFYNSGQIKAQIKQDGLIIKTYYENGNIKSDIKDDGSGIEYYDNGNVAVEYSKNQRKEYYKNGNLKSFVEPDGTVSQYYSNGKLQSIKRSDNTCESYNSKGYLTSKTDKNGLVHIYSYWNSDIIKQELVSDGTERYYSRGNLRRQKFPNGIVEGYADYKGAVENNPESEFIPGYTTLHGAVVLKVLPNGTYKNFDEHGNIIGEKTLLGKYVKY